MKSGKRAICAGPGNPPVVVDGTAHIAKAARGHHRRAPPTTTIFSASARSRSSSLEAYAWSAFIERTSPKAGAAKLINRGQLERLTGEAFTTGARCRWLFAPGAQPQARRRRRFRARRRMPVHRVRGHPPMLFAETSMPNIPSSSRSR
jgi:hypothetical protein